MWSPSHLQVTVHRARGLIQKGKHGNDCFATVAVGKEKFSTSLREKAVDPQWHEECDFEIPNMDSQIKINVYHRNLVGLDEFLGQLLMPLRDFDVHETPKSTWYPLRSKPGKKGEQKNRGELAVKVAFVVRSKKYYSTSDLAPGHEKKHSLKKSVTNLAGKVGDKLKLPYKKVSGLGSKTGSLQHLDQESSSLSPATPLANRRRTTVHASPGSIHSEPANPVKRSLSDAEKNKPDPQKSQPSLEEDSEREFDGNNPFNSSPTNPYSRRPPSDEFSTSPLQDSVFNSPPKHEYNSFGAPYKQKRKLGSVTQPSTDGDEVRNGQDEVDAGVIVTPSSETSEKSFTSLSHENSVAEEVNRSISSTSSADRVVYKSNKEKDKVKKYKETSKHRISSQKEDHGLKNGFAEEIEEHRKRISRQESAETLSPEILQKYKGMSKHQLITLIEAQKDQLANKDRIIKDLEDYIDKLLVQVMEVTPAILQSSKR